MRTNENKSKKLIKDYPRNASFLHISKSGKVTYVQPPSILLFLTVSLIFCLKLNHEFLGTTTIALVLLSNLITLASILESSAPVDNLSVNRSVLRNNFSNFVKKSFSVAFRRSFCLSEIEWRSKCQRLALISKS